MVCKPLSGCGLSSPGFGGTGKRGIYSHTPEFALQRTHGFCRFDIPYLTDETPGDGVT